MLCVLFPPERRQFGVKFMANRVRPGWEHVIGEVSAYAERNRDISVRVGLLISKTDSIDGLGGGFRGAVSLGES